MTPHNMQHRIVGARIAILDDYQNVALELADWSPVTDRATVTVFNDHLSDAEGIVDRLQEFDVVYVMRERTPLTREHPFRQLDNVIATPHIGYVSRDLYRVFYQDTVANIKDWLGRSGV